MQSRTGMAADGHGVLSIENERLAGASFDGLRLDKLSVVASQLTDCTFEGIGIEDANFGSGDRESHYTRCKFVNLRIRAPAPGVARFDSCSFESVRLEQFHSMACDFLNCTFSGVLQSGYIFGRVPREYTWIRRRTNTVVGNDFREARFGDFEFRAGVPLGAQLLPAGHEVVKVDDTGRALARLSDELRSLGDPDLTRRASVFIEVVKMRLQEGQAQLLLTSAVMSALGDDVEEWVRQVLTSGTGA